MSSKALIIEFPEGTTEFRTSGLLRPGDVVWHGDSGYSVVSVNPDGDSPTTVVVELRPPTSGQHQQWDEPREPIGES